MKKIVFGEKNWSFIRVFVKPFYHCFHDGERLREERFLEKKRTPLYSIFSEQIVLNGIFRGMTYPNFISVGSTLFPKLLGSYEKELEPPDFDTLEKQNL